MNMQVSVNFNQQQNPNFGHFKFSDSAIQLIKSRIKPNQLDKFKRIVAEENKNEIVEASVRTIGNTLDAELRIYDSKKDPITKYYKNLGSQGFLSKLLNGDIGFLKKVHNASEKLQEIYKQDKKIDEIISESLKA